MAPVAPIPASRIERRLAGAWNNLWHQLPAAGDGRKAFAELLMRYSEQHRAYHNLSHLRDCLEKLRLARHPAAKNPAVALALWFHDAIYIPRANDNEKRSVRLFKTFAHDTALPAALTAEVASLILATEHRVAPKSLGAKLITDIDLAILGASPRRFAEYDRQIRREYNWVSEDRFRAGRAAVLRSFLHRPRIYSTGFFHHRLEAQARKNLQNAVTKYAPLRRCGC